MEIDPSDKTLSTGRPNQNRFKEATRSRSHQDYGEIDPKVKKLLFSNMEIDPADKPLSTSRSNQAGLEEEYSSRSKCKEDDYGGIDPKVVKSLRKLNIGDEVAEQLIQSKLVQFQLAGMTQADGLDAVQKLKTSYANRRSREPIKDPIWYFVKILKRYKKDGVVVMALKKSSVLSKNVVNKILANRTMRPLLSSLTKAEGMEAIAILEKELGSNESSDLTTDPAGYFVTILESFSSKENNDPNGINNKRKRNATTNEEEEEEGEGDLRSQLRQAKRQAGAYKANWHKACKLNAELEVKVDKLTTDLEISKKRTESISSLESKVKELTEELESTKSKIPAEYTPAEFWDNFNADTITPTSGTSKESIQSFDPFEMVDESSEGVGIEEEVVADVAAMPVVNASSPSSCEDDVSSEIEKFDPFGSRSIVANQNVSDRPISLVEWRQSTSTSKTNGDKESLLQKDSIAKKTPSNKLRQRAQAVLKITKNRANNLLMKGPLTSSGTYNKMFEDSSKTKNNRRSHSVERLLEKSKQRVPEIMNSKYEGDNNSPAAVVDQEKKRDFVKENAEVMNLLRESKRRLSRQGSSKSDNDEDTCVSLGNDDDDNIPLTVVTKTGD